MSLFHLVYAFLEPYKTQAVNVPGNTQYEECVRLCFKLGTYVLTCMEDFNISPVTYLTGTFIGDLNSRNTVGFYVPDQHVLM